VRKNDNEERDEVVENKSRAFETIEKRMAKRRQRGSIGKLIFYVIALIIVIILMFWLRRSGL
jgi:predicted nucleic acid-binding Zn ribbon protein